MKRINLGLLNTRGLSLSPHQAIAVVHEVCELLKRSDERGHPLAPPALHELFVTEEGAVEIEPKHHSSESGSGGSFRRLIDELLPPDRTESEKKFTSDADAYGHVAAARPPRYSHATSTAIVTSDERDLLRQLFERGWEDETRMLQSSRAGRSPIAEPASAEPASPEPASAEQPTAVADVEESPTEVLTAIPIVFAADADEAFGEEVERAARSTEHLQPVADPHDARTQDEAQLAFSSLPPAYDERVVQDDELPDIGAVDTDPHVMEVEDDDVSVAEASFDGRMRSRVLFEPAFAAHPIGGGTARSTQHRVLAIAAAAIVLNVTVGLLAVPELRQNLLGVGKLLTDDGSEALDVEPSQDARNKKMMAAASTPSSSRRDPSDAAMSEPRRDERGSATPSPATAAEIAELRREHMLAVAQTSDESSLAPGGGLVAFADDRDDEPRGIYIAQADGSGAERVSGSGRAAAPIWSPDRTALAFVRTEPERSDVWNLWVYQVQSGELRRLSSHAGGVVRGATWFPQGDRLCYGHGTELTVVDAVTGDARSFSSPIPGRAVGRSSVSPDGRQVAFVLERDGVWVLDVETGRIRRVIEDVEAANDVTWARRGGRLLYYSLSTRGEGAWRGAPTGTRAAYQAP